MPETPSPLRDRATLHPAGGSQGLKVTQQCQLLSREHATGLGDDCREQGPSGLGSVEDGCTPVQGAPNPVTH